MHWTQTDEGRAKMRRLMKARWKSGEITGNTKQRASAERFDVGDKVIMTTPKSEVKQRAYGRTLYSLAKHVRTEIHKHVRAGNELEPLHTSMLALTDALTNGHDTAE